MNYSQLFMYIPGIIIFFVGSGQVRKWLALRKKGAVRTATVINAQHVVKKDKKDREVMNYYNILVEFLESEAGQKHRETVKTPVEYAKGQTVTIIEENGVLHLDDKPEESLFNPWILMIGGALLILLALFQNKGNEVNAMICLVLILIGAGAVLINGYVQLKRRHLQPIACEVVDVYKRQISKETKILRGSKFTYYPIVKYTLNGRDSIRRCSVNSSSEKEFKVGNTFNLYYDPEANIVLEKHENIINLGIGVILVVTGAVAAAGILSQLPL